MSKHSMIDEIVDKCIDNFWCHDRDMLLEMVPKRENTETYSFLWGYGAYLTMLTTYVSSGRYEKLPHLLHVLDKLEMYKTNRLGFYYYESHPRAFGYGEPYYDDNAWVILALNEAYRITKNKEYLLRAQAAAEYLKYGTHKELNGVYWREFNCNSLNTCSCGPTIMCFLELYELTKIQDYFDRAKKIYDFSIKYLMDKDGTFFDSIKADTLKVAEEKYTYNTGTMIENGVRLYKLTNEKAYLDNAITSCNGAVNHFLKKLPATPWFHVYLARGFKQVESVTGDKSFCVKLKEKLDFAVKSARTDIGLVCQNWSGENNVTPYYHQGLEQFGTAECMVVLEDF